MQLTQEKAGKYLLIQAEGRLDASWSDYFLEEMRTVIRNGEHHILIDAAKLVFLSSAGIRSLLIVHKELRSVQGAFQMINAYGMVRETLTCSGFEQWLRSDMPADCVAPASDSRRDQDTGVNEIIGQNAGRKNGCEVYPLDQNAAVTVTRVSAWTPWNPVRREACRRVRCSETECALGIGCAAREYDQARDHFGEFLAVAGHVVSQPPSERARPDYMLAEKDFVPIMFAPQALHWNGEMSHVLRFQPTDEQPVWGLSQILDQLLGIIGGRPTAFVIMGEIEGLVGVSLTRSPGKLATEDRVAFPELRDWMSFCGERSFAHEQALIVGVVAPASFAPASTSLALLPSRPDLAVHTHAAVFPYQPLQNGQIDLKTSVAKWFSGAPPRAVMHLFDDVRPAVGLGESGLIRGAAWCSPIENPEVLS